MRDLILVLGHFDDTVHLTQTGRERLDLGIALLYARPGSKISVTGCADNHSRTIEVRDYLLSHGVTALSLAALIDSHNTAEDAFLAGSDEHGNWGELCSFGVSGDLSFDDPKRQLIQVFGDFLGQRVLGNKAHPQLS